MVTSIKHFTMDKEAHQRLEPVIISFEQNWVPQKAQKLQPQVYKDGDLFCCLFGPDPETGIFGCGNTPEAAVLDWEKELEKRIARLTEGDEAAHHAFKHLGQH